ncbi:hypothetical protein [Arthrobacter sp. B2a2-09]|uniref:hypothetical protein n=1 Tax=Arthrobacter sp. B2a2-09 TaxID=2952822 RepID=UPI0022CDB2BE|nr:hypothetical protein [Arthrobacter sp. B2a2-09]MCZ9880640.1 hypothetical protein [Arthrobacter sp. B2a2-09]
MFSRLRRASARARRRLGARVASPHCTSIEDSPWSAEPAQVVAVQLAKALGAAKVVAADRNPDLLTRSRRNGADACREGFAHLLTAPGLLQLDLLGQHDIAPISGFV